MAHVFEPQPGGFPSARPTEPKARWPIASPSKMSGASAARARDSPAHSACAALLDAAKPIGPVGCSFVFFTVPPFLWQRNAKRPAQNGGEFPHKKDAPDFKGSHMEVVKPMVLTSYRWVAQLFCRFLQRTVDSSNPRSPAIISHAHWPKGLVGKNGLLGVSSSHFVCSSLLCVLCCFHDSSPSVCFFWFFS